MAYIGDPQHIDGLRSGALGSGAGGEALDAPSTARLLVLHGLPPRKVLTAAFAAQDSKHWGCIRAPSVFARLVEYTY